MPTSQTEVHSVACRGAICLSNAAVSLILRGCFDDARILFLNAIRVTRLIYADPLNDRRSILDEIQRLTNQITQFSCKQGSPLLENGGIKVFHTTSDCPMLLSMCPFALHENQYTFINIEEEPLSDRVGALEVCAGLIIYNLGIAHLVHTTIPRVPLSLRIPLHLIKSALAVLTQEAQRSLENGIPDLFSCVSMLALAKLVFMLRCLGQTEEVTHTMESFGGIRSRFLRLSCGLPKDLTAAPAA